MITEEKERAWRTPKKYMEITTSEQEILNFQERTVMFANR